MPDAMSHFFVDQLIKDRELAVKSLKWMLEHRVYWNPSLESLVEPTGIKHRPLLAEPPIDVHAFILALAREIDLEAVHAT